MPGPATCANCATSSSVLLAEGEALEPSDFETLHTVRGPAQAVNASGEIELPVDGLNLDDVERRLVTLALERTHGIQTCAAALLGLHRDQIPACVRLRDNTHVSRGNSPQHGVANTESLEFARNRLTHCLVRVLPKQVRMS